MPIIDRLTEATGVMGTAGYAHAVTVTGRLAFISGQVAFDESGHAVGVDDIAAQTRQAMRNLESILTSLGAGWADVVKSRPSSGPNS